MSGNDKRACRWAWWIALMTTVMMFVGSPARLEGEMNPLSFFVCSIPAIVGLPALVLGYGKDDNGEP